MERLLSLFDGIVGSSRAFIRDRAGSMPVMVATVGTVALVAAGAAVDLNTGHENKRNLQDAVDAAALSVVRSGMEAGAARDASAEAFVRANVLGRLDTDRLRVTTHTLEEGAVRVDAVALSRTSFMGLVGLPDFEIDATSTAAYGGSGSSTADIALVMDTTLSMKGARLDALKEAVTELVAVMEENGTARLSLVPFGRYVNIGMENADEPGLDIPETTYHQTEEHCFTDEHTERSNCRTVQGTCSGCEWHTVSRPCERDGEMTTCNERKCRSYQYSCEKQQCDTRKVQGEERCYGGGEQESGWLGCMGSLEYPANAFADVDGQGAPGLRDEGCGTASLRLTNDYDALRRRIGRLSAEGKTYIPAGLVWGWRMLSPGLPFPDTNRDSDRKRVLILMGDGNNSVSKKPGRTRHQDDIVADANNLTLELCGNIRDAGIEVYTVAFQVSMQEAKDVLKECASDPARTFYDVRDVAELTDAFKAAAGTQRTLRLVR